MARTTFLITLLPFVSAVVARTVEHNFKISNGKIAPDGVERVGTLVNDMYPGPLICADKGDTLKINVQNELTDSSMYRTTSIVSLYSLPAFGHAELLRSTGMVFYKVEMLTKMDLRGSLSAQLFRKSHILTLCLWVNRRELIGITATLTAFAVHSLFVVCYFIQGSMAISHLIVTIDPQDPHRQLYDVDDDKTVLVIGDWYHDSSKNILESRNRTRQQPDSATINGKGIFDPNNTPANPNTLYALKVQQGKRYRLRIINTSAVSAYRVSIQGHKLKVIAADGVSTQPYDIDAFDIIAGQRIDCIVEANQTPQTYWINAPLTNVANKTAQALLIYEGSTSSYQPPKGSYNKWNISQANIDYWKQKETYGPRSERSVNEVRALGTDHRMHSRNMDKHNGIIRRQEQATTNQNAMVVMDESKLVPLANPGAACGPNPADLVLNLTFGLASVLRCDWMINGIPYQAPSTPTLLKILTDRDSVTESDFARSEHTIILPENKCIEFNIKGNTGLGIVHPIHLHGHTFDVVQFGNNTPNYVNPPRRDVVGATDDGVRIQFKTDNPGPWFLHCHIDWHLAEGFAMVFAEAPESIKAGPQSVVVNPQWEGLCKKYSELPAGFE
ncbi:unnamed protein product [Rhizoctonia solani]|uniref:laccase n=1 Tax=Rhizoctonia solani TaxID=456999 RepID=A0A8H3E2H0_9AGAM|nr:unnamed protein product [Rhizoctonia solani]